ncbi:galactoside alpha-(1,2)-fucosyltransferase 2-like [Macrobrachium rosenbergii]|uniref:galactoside alpha-(1,2)-fucosyltransferase 2-like n=1 Tax=Macrobrachium rosenbergii TaxID=79674 RepID=UPI0034D68D5E
MVFNIFYTFSKSSQKDLTQLEKLFVFLLVITSSMLIAIYGYQNFLANNSASKLKIVYVSKFTHSVQEHVNQNSVNLGSIDANSDELVPVIRISFNVSQTVKQNIQRNARHTISNVQDSANNIRQNVAQLQTFANHSKSKVMKQETVKSRKEDNFETGTESRKEESLLQSMTRNNNKCLTVPKLHIPKVDLHECSSHHVIIHDGGRLGNEMSQYISLYLLRHIFGIRVSITGRMKSTLSLYFKNISLPVQDFKCFTRNTKRIMYDNLYNMLHTKALEHFKRRDKGANMNLLNESYYIFHHPCPREVITAHRSLVRKVLTFQDDIMKKAKRNIKKALKYKNRSWHNSTLVTVHVRRRDYTRYIMKHYNLTQLDEVYFQRAFNFFRKRTDNPVFVVVSDDHGWCHEVLETSDVVVAGTKKDPIIDMAVLSLGDHHIISYGTFSFLGATLGHGTIVHPVTDNKLYDHYNCVEDNIFQPISRDKYVN